MITILYTYIESIFYNYQIHYVLACMFKVVKDTELGSA